MQFMVFMIPAVYQPKNGKPQPGPDFKPDPKMMAEMGKFNDELRKAGALLSVNGLQPPASGARLAFAAGKPTVTDGPAINAGEVLGGYWLVEATTKQQVIDWWKRCPAQDGDVIEIREVAGSGAGDNKSSRNASRSPHGSTGAPGPWKRTKGARSKEQD